MRGLLDIFKSVLRSRELSVPILTGPFRGGIVQLDPRHGLRKVFGIYEHELNPWLAAVLPRVNTVIDIEANEGYFTFGAASAFGRLNKQGEILAYEPDAEAFEKLKIGVAQQKAGRVQIYLQMLRWSESIF